MQPKVDKKKYPTGSEYYTLYEVIGQGVSASVHRALCIPFNETVAIKILDFERDNSDLNSISREAQTMMLVDHPNVLKAHCSFVSDHSLWVVMPYMAGGSCLHILKAAYPGGFEEAVIATILRETLKGLEYLHNHGNIHRDIKAGNILINARGGIKLGDFGVSTCLFDSGDRQRTRNTFVGTPCWMAPEVMQQSNGYDFKADIWSFGITALELAHGHAPFSKYPPMKVLLMTLQNAPPGLDYERDKKFSRSFKQMIALCLAKDPPKRPSAKKLLKHSFFKKARSNDYILQTILKGLPDLGDCMQALKRKEEDMLAEKKMPDGQREEISQDEYKRGISHWDFDLDNMKAQASLIQDIEEHVPDGNRESSNLLCALDLLENPLESQEDCNGQAAHKPYQSLGDKALTITRVDKSDDDSSIASPSYEHYHVNSSPRPVDQTSSAAWAPFQVNGKLSDSLIPSSLKLEVSTGNAISPDRKPPPIKVESKPTDILQSTSANNRPMNPHGGGDILPELPLKASKSSANMDELDEKGKPHVVQQRGRFKVTSENVDLEKVVSSAVLQKSHSMQVLTQNYGVSTQPSLPPSETSSNLSSPSSFAPMNLILQSNVVLRDYNLSTMKSISSGDATTLESNVNGVESLQNIGSAAEKTLLLQRETASEREKELLLEIIELQRRLIRAHEDLQRHKSENT